MIVRVRLVRRILAPPSQLALANHHRYYYFPRFNCRKIRKSNPVRLYSGTYLEARRHGQQQCGFA